MEFDMLYYDLVPIYDGRKSFYGKARVVEDEDGKTLISYTTKVCRIDKNGNVERLWSGNSQTTNRHVKEFLRQNGKDYEDYRRQG